MTGSTWESTSIPPPSPTPRPSCRAWRHHSPTFWTPPARRRFHTAAPQTKNERTGKLVKLTVATVASLQTERAGAALFSRREAPSDDKGVAVSITSRGAAARSFSGHDPGPSRDRGACGIGLVADAEGRAS